MASSRQTILIVEDDPLLRMMAVEFIEEAGFNALSASNAIEAVKLLETRIDIRLLFTDVDMPGGMDGAKLAAIVRNRWPPIGIVITSGFIDKRGPMLSERSVFVQKPYDIDALIDTFKSLIH